MERPTVVFEIYDICMILNTSCVFFADIALQMDQTSSFYLSDGLLSSHSIFHCVSHSHLFV